jgi:hypothetical protein
VVCFESAAPESGLLRSLVKSSGSSYTAPPLTLVEITGVQEGSFEYLPGKMINQTLITVRVTYKVPATKGPAADENGGSKFASECNFLTFGTAGDCLRGMDDILDDPVLTMEEGWLRNDQWADWQGKTHHGAVEWQYVTRPTPSSDVRMASGSGVGGRDVLGKEMRDSWALRADVPRAGECPHPAEMEGDG